MCLENCPWAQGKWSHETSFPVRWFGLAHHMPNRALQCFLVFSCQHRMISRGESLVDMPFLLINEFINMNACFMSNLMMVVGNASKGISALMQWHHSFMWRSFCSISPTCSFLAVLFKVSPSRSFPLTFSNSLSMRAV